MVPGCKKLIFICYLPSSTISMPYSTIEPNHFTTQPEEQTVISCVLRERFLYSTTGHGVVCRVKPLTFLDCQLRVTCR